MDAALFGGRVLGRAVFERRRRRQLRLGLPRVSQGDGPVEYWRARFGVNWIEHEITDSFQLPAACGLGVGQAGSRRAPLTTSRDFGLSSSSAPSSGRASEYKRSKRRTSAGRRVAGTQWMTPDTLTPTGFFPTEPGRWWQRTSIASPLFGDNFITGDTRAVAQTDRGAWGKPLVTRRRLKDKVVLFDQDLPLQGDAPLAWLTDIRREVRASLHVALWPRSDSDL